MTCHIVPAHQPRGNLGAASLNHFALLNPMHKCFRAEAETPLCSVKAAVVLSWEKEGTDPALLASKVACRATHCRGGWSWAALLPGGMLRRARQPGPSPHREGPVCLAYVHPSPVHRQHSAPYLFCTPLCTAGPPLPEEEPGHHR